MMEVVSPFINPDLFVCRQYPSLGRPTGTSSRFIELSETLTAYTGSVNSGKWVNLSALPLCASRFRTNNSHVPIRSKFLPPSLFSKKVKAEKLELDYLSLQELLVGLALQTAPHLATTATVACERMVRFDVPPDVHSLFRGQAVCCFSLGRSLTCLCNLDPPVA